MRKRITAGLLAAAVATAALVPATSAFAATAGTTVPAATAQTGPPVDLSVSAPATAPASGDGVPVTVTADADTAVVRLKYGSRTINLTRVGGDKFQGTLPLDGAKVGERRSFVVEARDKDGKVLGRKTDTIQISNERHAKHARHSARISLKASKTSVEAGKKVTLSGYLRSEHSGLPGENVRIYFQASGSSEYTYVSSIWTGSRGYYSEKVPVQEDGTWKAVYVGGHGNRPASRTVSIDAE